MFYLIWILSCFQVLSITISQNISSLLVNGSIYEVIYSHSFYKAICVVEMSTLATGTQ